MKSEKRMFLSFILNFVFTIIEFIGGLITNSVALLSDSVHDLGDSISIGIAIYLEKKSKKKPDEKYTYGYRRFSLLGALISSIILLIGSGVIIFEAINRLINPELINTELIIYFAIFGVVVNGLAAFNTSKGKSLNEKAITLHMFEDVLGWFALLVASIIMHYTDILILDALLSLAFTIFIIFHALRNLKQVFNVFLEASPKDIDIDQIIKELETVNHVVKIHHFHVWSLEGSYSLCTLHAVIKDSTINTEIIKVQNRLIEILKSKSIKHVTIQLEFESYKCIDNECDPDEPLNIGHNHHH
ncbi:cation diffusion facilitator family transporter [Candidatus Izemoplasma sp. B36]|uniref:cation diffusion facilitator family transporter n=1 Tax=Candidatus Izemoplasma sp. B36 TaxID=3242468 RepID=UPI003557C25D